jgi:putative membrane protein
MGGMMGGGGGAWMVLWIVLAIAVSVAAGVVVVRALSYRRGREQRQVSPPESAAVQDAKDALKLRYARGEIGREDYLQGKVELED